MKQMITIARIVVLFLSACPPLFGFGIDPVKFEIIVHSGEQVNLKYQLVSDKNVSEKVSLGYKPFNQNISFEQISADQKEIILEPTGGKPAYASFLVKTTKGKGPEAILEIYFSNQPIKKSQMINLQMRMTSRVYIRYKDLMTVDYNIENVSSKTIQDASTGGVAYHYLITKFTNMGNVYIRPGGSVELIKDNGSVIKTKLNATSRPIYTGTSLEIKSELKSPLSSGKYSCQIKVETKPGVNKNFNFRLTADNGRVQLSDTTNK